MDPFDYPTTELSAVNHLLRDLGEEPVGSLVDLDDDAESALGYIRRAVRELQVRSWHWNAELHDLTRDTNNEFLLPPNTVSVDTVDINADVPVVERSGKLYNLTPFETGTVFPKHETLKVRIVLSLTYDDLPEVARQYAYTRASRQFLNASDGATQLSRFAAADEQIAWNRLVADDARRSDSKFRVRGSHSIYDRVPR